MRLFTPNPGPRSALHILKTPFADIAAFNAIVQMLILQNPLGCTSYRTVKKHHLPVSKVRERYTANHRVTNGGLLHVSTRDVPPGAYVLRVRAGATAAEKLVIVVP